MKHGDELDRLLDAGLASYSADEPLAGIESRVMRRVAARRRRPLWWAAAAVPAMACLVLMVAGRETAPVELPPMPVAAIPAAQMVYAPVAPKVVRPRAVKQLVKLEQFPTPTPLTAQERGLLELLARAPEALRMEPPPAELTIEPIQIAPLEIGGTD